MDNPKEIRNAYTTWWEDEWGTWWAEWPQRLKLSAAPIPGTGDRFAFRVVDGGGTIIAEGDSCYSLGAARGAAEEHAHRWTLRPERYACPDGALCPDPECSSENDRRRAAGLLAGILLLLLAGAAAPLAAAPAPWFGTDPGPYAIHHARTWELPALLNTLEKRCLSVVGIVPAGTIQEETCTLAPVPPGRWGCHPSDPNDPTSPVVCVDPPPREQVCTVRTVTDSVIVSTRKGPDSCVQSP